MRKALFAALLLLPLIASAQSVKHYPSTFTGQTALAAPAADNCSAVPYSFTGDTNTGLCTSAADTFNLYTAGASRLSGNSTAVTSTVPFWAPNGAQTTPSLSFANDPNTGFYTTGSDQLVAVAGGAFYFDMTGGAFRFYNGYDIQFLTDDASDIGTATSPSAHLFVRRSIQGSKSKTLTDNTATAFVRLTVADDDYEGCAFGWTAYAEDADTDARQVRKGRTNVAILNNSGTEACNFSAAADDQAILVTAGTFTCTFDCNSASADTVDLRATCDTSLNAAAETLTFEYRLDCESVVTTVTPQ